MAEQLAQSLFLPWSWANGNGINSPKWDQMSQMGSIAPNGINCPKWDQLPVIAPALRAGVKESSALLCPLQSTPLTLDPNPSLTLPEYLEGKLWCQQHWPWGLNPSHRIAYVGKIL